MTRKWITEEIKKYVADTCDRCNTPIETEYPNQNDHQLRIEFGYGSMYDMEIFTIILCDECFEKYYLEHFKMYGEISEIKFA